MKTSPSRTSYRHKTGSLRICVALVLSLASLSAVSAAQDRVHLLGIALVDQKNVRLSDVLYPDAPDTLRRMAEGIILGVSPQPGSVREFSREQIEHGLAGEPSLLARLEIPLGLRVERRRWPIAADLIQNALHRFFRVSGAEGDGRALSGTTIGVEEKKGSRTIAVHEPPQLALSPRAAVDAYGATCEPGQLRLQVRLRCRDRLLCGDFMVTVTDATVVAARCAHNPLSAGQRSILLVPAGSKAMLHWQIGNVRLSLPVVCLESGSLGQIVRVLDADSHRILRGQVMGVGELMAIA